jgi:hypothetical protein
MCVCHRRYVWLNEAEYEAWNAALDEVGLSAEHLSLPELWETRITDTWERIFDVESLVASGDWSDAVQATFERLDLADVVRVTEFTTRRRET